MKKVYTAFLVVLFASMSVFSQNGWVQLTDYPGSGSAGVVGFTFYSQGLAGMGYYNVNSNCYTDFWSYEPMTSSWVQKQNFSGNQRYQQSSFTIGKYGYVCLGSDASSYFRDLWQYNEDSNAWSRKADFPGAGRYGAVGYGTVTKAYVGLGEDDNSSGITDYLTDFYEYDQISNTWSAKASFPGQGRFYSFSFVVNEKLYVVGGRSENASNAWVYLKDMWCYDPASNAWTQKTTYPGSGSMGISGFVIGNYAYVGLGYNGVYNYNDFWRYDYVSDTWLQLADFPGGSRRGAMCFSIVNTGYLGCGYSTTFKYDFWQYNDPLGINTTDPASGVNVYPVPADRKVTIEGRDISKIMLYNSSGALVNEMQPSPASQKSTIDISSLSPGHYYAKIFVGNEVICKKVIKF